MTCEECGSHEASQHREGDEMVILCDECRDSFQPTEEEFAELRQMVLENAAKVSIKTR